MGAKNEFQQNREEILGQRQKPEFQQGHIVPLKAVAHWDAHDIEIQKTHNRILNDFTALTADTVIDLAKTTKEDWLTDFVCPRVQHACKLNIAADLITQYRVSSDDLNETVQKIFEHIISNNANFLEKIENKIENELNLRQSEIKENALNSLKKKYPDITETSSTYSAYLEKFSVVEEQKLRKAITHKQMKEALQPLYPQIEEQLGLKKKSTFPQGENIDYSILGAAGSGKSTISKDLIKQDKLDCVVLATDDYRGVSFNDDFEDVKTDQIFTRTQDTAYSIKELVQERLTSATLQERPNIILDCVSLEGWHRKLLTNNKETHSAVACLNDVSLVPSRAYTRALDPNSGPADKGRQVNTKALLKGHGDASAYLLTSIPLNVKTKLYDTNVSRGTKPPVMARVHTEQNLHQVEILNLSRFASFLAKANVNSEANVKGDLYYKANQEYAVVNDSQYKAEQLLKLIPKAPPYKNDNYELVLNSKSGIPYAKVAMVDDKIKVEVLDRKEFDKLLKDNFPQSEGFILKSMIMQIHFGSMAEVRKEIKVNGREETLKTAINGVVPEFKSKLKSSNVILDRSMENKENISIETNTGKDLSSSAGALRKRPKKL